MKIDVFVMAAGRSSRFGAPKQLQIVEGKPLFLHVVNRIEHETLLRKTIVTGAYHNALADLTPTDVNSVYAPHWHQGLSASILAAVEHIDDIASHFMIALADQVAINAVEYKRLIDTAADKPSSIIAARYSGINAVPAIFPKQKLTLLKRLTGDKGAGVILNSDPDVIAVEIQSAAFDIDTLEDLDQFTRTEL